MSKLIAIDDGHGMSTPGKRTPIFQDGTVSPETGKPYMHENEFNRAVASLLAQHLIRCGFRILMVAPGDDDVPLRTRTDTANNASADFYISIHANALSGSWGNANGIETYHYPNSREGERAARAIHAQMLQGTRLKDRGVKTANFHVLRESRMTAVLVECAFMDNLQEAKLLLSHAYRSECAKEIAKGICEYFGVQYIEDSGDEEMLKEIEARVGTLEEITRKKPAPDWFVKEFGSADLGGVINEPTGTDEFWRGLAITIRLARAGKLG